MERANPDSEPETAEAFEALVAGQPHSSHAWIRYMAFLLTLGDAAAACPRGGRASPADHLLQASCRRAPSAAPAPAPTSAGGPNRVVPSWRLQLAPWQLRHRAPMRGPGTFACGKARTLATQLLDCSLSRPRLIQRGCDPRRTTGHCHRNVLQCARAVAHHAATGARQGSRQVLTSMLCGRSCIRQSWRPLLAGLRREEDEKFNVWKALMNLENNFGSPPEGAAMACFHRAAQHTDPKRLHVAAADMFASSDRVEAARTVLKAACRRFSQSAKVQPAPHPPRLADEPFRAPPPPPPPHTRRAEMHLMTDKGCRRCLPNLRVATCARST